MLKALIRTAPSKERGRSTETEVIMRPGNEWATQANAIQYHPAPCALYMHVVHTAYCSVKCKCNCTQEDHHYNLKLSCTYTTLTQTGTNQSTTIHIVFKKQMNYIYEVINTVEYDDQL